MWDISGYIRKRAEQKRKQDAAYTTLSRAVPTRTYAAPPQPTIRRSDEPTENVGMSMAVGLASGNAMLGYVAGGSLVGGMLGASMASSSAHASEPDSAPSTPSFSGGGGSYDGGGSSSSYDSGASSSDSGSSSCGGSD